jgi:hypothetical protein
MNGFAGGISPGTRPEPVVTLLRSMLAVKPGGRPASARELLTALPASHRQPVILVYLILVAFGRF